jgi:enamine deaminase RidA (YjgF/YER057c/UK114 family)
MRRGLVLVTFPLIAACASGTGGRGGGGEFGGPEAGEMGPRRFNQSLPQNAAPDLPGPELEGPPDSATIGPVLHLTATEAGSYETARDSFMLATKPQRDSALARRDLMNARLDAGDRVGAIFHAERLQRLGAWLKERQDAFENGLSSIFTSDQVQSYRDWRKAQDAQAKAEAEEDSLRWIEASVGNARNAAVRKTFVVSPKTASPEVGSQGVRVGRTLYLAAQLPIDSGGAIVGEGDLGAQADQAFANLVAVLAAGNALPDDVVRLTIYVVDYEPAALEPIRRVVAEHFPGRHAPVTTVVGVQSLAKPGALIAVEAVAERTDSSVPIPRRAAEGRQPEP